MEGNTPLPPHSTEESPQQSEVQNTTTSQEEVPIPLENFRIVSESPEAYRIPEGYERQILHLNSAGEFVVVNPSDIPAGSSQNPLANDPFWTADVVRSPPRLVRDLYGTGEGADAPFSYTVPPNHFTGTTTFTATPPVGPNTPSVGPRSTIPLQTAHSTMAPHIPTIPAGNAVVNQAPIGTPVTPRPTLPFGFRALNASTATTAQTTTQVIPGSSIPIQQPGGTGLGGPNPLGNTGQSLTSGSQISTLSRELYLKLGGILPPEDKFHSGGTLMLGGILPPEDKFHSGDTLMLGGSLNPESTINHMDKMCPPHPIRGTSFPKETHSSRQDKMFRPRNNPLMDKCQTHPITHKTHPVILRSHMLLKTSQILCTLVKTNLT
jgi:hypothetical protein